ncbi:small ribosomal subunit protein mS26 [Parasteatoda tepidariorum]|uniref:Small ribosomal subunit protein mS26 n=1 Tax=Parasteatoda tepidariorum TaxID=114398 RepID=A0A2L2Y0C0_PARTP|nr:probable 28S ribosomal protein S26, mitochondrial [Parasteatoda tepidariorum]
MAQIIRSFLCKNYITLQHGFRGSIYNQLRWRRKEPKRKPLWMPTAKSKLFRIPQHPYVSEEEKDLIDDLLDEYYIKLESLRKLFQEELKQKFEDEGFSLKKQQESKENFLSLLEENKKENERIKLIREETLERLFQEKALKLLEFQEQKKVEDENIKLKVDEIVRKEKEKVAGYITYENLDEAIEKAMENPVNYNFCIDVNGSLKWEGKPPAHFEEEMKRRMDESIAKN